jgi:cyclopropane-fatty-acyl-phospholipid synthase
MWEMYLVGCEIAFRRQDHMVFQMQRAKAVDTVPLTRDYILDWERAQSACDVPEFAWMMLRTLRRVPSPP